MQTRVTRVLETCADASCCGHPNHSDFRRRISALKEKVHKSSIVNLEELRATLKPLIALAKELPELPNSSLRADKKRQLVRLVKAGEAMFEDPVKPATEKKTMRPTLNTDDLVGPEDIPDVQFEHESE